MKRVTAIVLFGILAAAYSAGSLLILFKFQLDRETIEIIDSFQLLKLI